MAEDADNQTPACPTCGSAAVVRIAYGLPGNETIEAAERGEMMLGGCIVSSDSPEWLCTACHTYFGDHEETFRRLFPKEWARRHLAREAAVD